MMKLPRQSEVGTFYGKPGPEIQARLAMVDLPTSHMRRLTGPRNGSGEDDETAKAIRGRHLLRQARPRNSSAAGDGRSAVCASSRLGSGENHAAGAVAPEMHRPLCRGHDRGAGSLWAGTGASAGD